MYPFKSWRYTTEYRFTIISILQNHSQYHDKSYCDHNNYIITIIAQPYDVYKHTICIKWLIKYFIFETQHYKINFYIFKPEIPWIARKCLEIFWKVFSAMSTAWYFQKFCSHMRSYNTDTSCYDCISRCKVPSVFLL